MIRLAAVAIVFVGLLTASDTSYGQLSSRPIQTWTLSERHAWDPENVLPPGDAAKEYVLQAPAPEGAPPERLPYFVRHLNSDNSSIAADALDEASLVDVKHFRMLPASEVEPLKTYIINPDVDEFRLNLDRLVAGYLLAAGDVGLDVMDESFFRNKERGFNEVYAAMTALRFVWSSDDSRIEKERLRASMRLLIDRPEIADLVITELALWKDWSVQDEVVALYGKGEFDTSSVKRAILRYLLTSDRDVPDKASDDDFDRITRTRKHLEDLKERDPETYQQASRFFPLSDPRPREPKQGRDDARGDFAPVASGLSGLRIYTSAIHTITFSRDGETLLSGSGDGTLGWWDVGSGASIEQVKKAHDAWCFSIAARPDGLEIATGGGDQLVKRWEHDTRNQITLLDHHTDDVHAVAYDLEGERLFSAGDDRSVVCSDPAERTVVWRRQLHTEPIPCLAVSPDGSVIASGSRDDTVRLWDAETGELLHLLNGHTGDVHSVAFSPDGTILASGSYDETVRLWNVESGELANTLHGHTNWVFSVAFDPLARLIASGDKDGRIILWDAESGAEVGVLKRQRHVSCVVFSPDGSVLASSSAEATICLWDPRARTLQKVLQHTETASGRDR